MGFTIERTLGLIALAGIAVAGAQALVHSTAPAQDWTRLFTRKEGWTGADGIFAIPLNGYEGPDRAAEGRTLFVFSDTFIGSVDSTGKRFDATMVNNSLAVLEGGAPDPAKIRFHWGRTADGKTAAAFTPTIPSPTGGKAWYWLQDGFFHKGHVYNLPLHVVENPDAAEGWKFREAGIGFLKIPIGPDGTPDLAKTTQKATPLYHSAAGRTFYYGCGILVNTAAAGAPNPDGYVYVYGRNSLYVAQVLPDAFEDFSAWRYWDGAGWSTDIAKSASLGAGGPELSVSPITRGPLKGKYLLVTCGLEADIWIRIGETPYGPFGPRINVYKAPEWDAAVPVYVYNAKAHPSLSANGDWLVSYNVNTSNWTANLARADIYRPRFFHLRLEEGAIGSTGLGSPPGRREGLRGAGDAPWVWALGESGMPLLRPRGGDGATDGAGTGLMLRVDGRSLRLERAR